MDVPNRLHNRVYDRKNARVVAVFCQISIFLPACDLIQNVIESNNLYLLHSIFSGGEKAVFAKLDLPITFY